jgi:hypothetical protein
MKVKLTSRVPLNSNEEILRASLEAELQIALDRLSSGADYRIHEPVIRAIGQQWLMSSDHDYSILLSVCNTI